MYGLPKWLVPTVLALGVGALVWSQRQEPLKIGDTVAVQADKLASATGQTLPPTVLNQTVLAFRVLDDSDPNDLRAELIGFYDGNGALQTLPASRVGVGPFRVPRSTVQAAFRGTKKL